MIPGTQRRMVHTSCGAGDCGLGEGARTNPSVWTPPVGSTLERRFADYRDSAFANNNFSRNLALETLAPSWSTTARP